MKNVRIAMILALSFLIQQSPNAQTNSRSWQYWEKKDEMRNETVRFAMLENEGYIYTDRGNSKVNLTLRKSPNEESVMLRTDSGIFTCDGNYKKMIAMKFDAGAIEKFHCSRPSDGSADVLFLSPESDFIKKLRKAKKLIVETEFYGQGRKQMTFLPEGLKW